MTGSPIIDAYCHVGLPRFGSAEDAWKVMTQQGVERLVFVLGPDVPDYATLFGALRFYGDRVRGVGIPFGETPAQIRTSIELQLRAGVMGLRMQPEHLLRYPDALTLLGEAGRWCYAIGAASSPEVVRTLLAWLERYPKARIAAPHFLAPHLLLENENAKQIEALVAHPRFFPIFSRHGGVGSEMAYPHPDLLLWIRQVIALAGWDKILWGSEYPVLYWRNEAVPACQKWLSAVLEELGPAQEAAFLGGNAARVIFGEPAPPSEEVRIPDWVGAQFNRNRTVSLFPEGLDVPMDVYASLHHRFVTRMGEEPDLSFAEFVTRLLEEQG